MNRSSTGAPRNRKSESHTCPASDLRAAILIYLIAERPDGATVGHLAQLGLAGRSEAQEIEPVSAAVSELVGEGQVTIRGKVVVPV